MELLIAKFLFNAPWILITMIMIITCGFIIYVNIIDPIAEKIRNRKEDKMYLNEMKGFIKEREA